MCSRHAFTRVQSVDATMVLRRIVRVFRQARSLVHDVHSVSGAKVPIVKFRTREYDVEGE
jgi:hypothetical protein